MYFNFLKQYLSLVTINLQSRSCQILNEICLIWFVDTVVERKHHCMKMCPLLRMFTPLVFDNHCDSLSLLIPSSTINTTSLLLPQRADVSPIWWTLSSRQAMPDLRAQVDSCLLSCPCTSPFSTAWLADVSPVSLANFLTLLVAMASTRARVSEETSLNSPNTIPIRSLNSLSRLLQYWQ